MEQEQLSSTAYRVRLDRSYCEVLEGWEKEPDFRESFSRMLADCEFAKFVWEAPPLHQENLDQRFEFVVTATPRLSAQADQKPFSSHFQGAEDSVLIFPSLGNDALLAVPIPRSSSTNYAHLASFLRTGTRPQKHRLWQQTCRAVKKRLGAQPLWLSTSGFGVSWLHVRVDSRPKYYQHAPYRNF